MPSYEEVRYHFNHHDPFARHMGIELLEVGPEHGVAIMPLDERHRNGMGHAHGGAIFALVDMTFATVSNAAGLYCVNAQTNI
ncbi:MAG: PaaI family thioesterase, partial [Bilophila wadsworthia]